MRLTIKLVSIVVFGIFLLISIDAYLSIRRDVKLYDADMESHALLIGRALRPVIAFAWPDSGERQALRITEEANRDEHQVRIRWVSLAPTEDDSLRPRSPLERLAQVVRGEEVSLKGRDADGERYRYTYVPVVVADGLVGAIEISEPLAALDQYVRDTILRTIVLVAVSVLLSAIAIRFLGLQMVGRPLHLLADKARRVGSGDFGEPLRLRGHQELGELATALNAMSDQLALAREEVLTENAAKIEAIEQARHTDRLRTIGELAAGVAHELGTPLNVISGRADLIVNGDVPAQQIAECAGIIKAQSRRMTTIIRELLDFGRRRLPGKMSLDLGELVRRTLDVLAPLAQKHNVTLQLDTADVPTVQADPTQLQQVVTNLVVNAIQAMPESGPVQLSLRSGPARPPDGPDGAEKEYVSIRVRDVGDGMSEETKARIFDPFFTTKRGGEGTGLGLAIAHRIVHEHGGWIDVTSELGTGSSFIIYLPLGSD